MIRTFVQSYQLKNTYRVNCIIYSVKQIPLIKKLLPSSLYSNKELKLIANVISGLIELMSVFLLKPLYVLLMIYLMAMLPSKDLADNFLHIFTLLTLNGVILNSHFFNPSKDKFYAMVLLKMDARKYTLSNYYYFLGKTFLGLLPACLIFGLLANVKVLLCVMMPLFVVCAKVTYSAWLLCKSQKYNKTYNENTPTALRWIVIIVILGAAYGLPFVGFTMDSFIFKVLFVVVCCTSIPAFIYLFRFANYRNVYRNLLTAENIVFDTKKFVTESSKTNFEKHIDTSIIFVEGKEGYAYFHEIFVMRHRKILTRSAKHTALITLVIFLGALYGVFLSPEFSKQINKMTLTLLPYFLFIMYMINRGQTITQAMFMNCDHSMLTYRFYRQPKAILGLFTKRLTTLIKINLLPAAIIAMGLPLLLYCSGGTDNLWNYIVLFITIICMSIFFSVHYLVLYYLLQPYNSEAETKSSMYSIVTSVTYFVAFMAIHVELPTLQFGTTMIVFTVLYVVIALFLAYRYAPKTFRLR